ncbi:hypothetical protein Tco_1177407, partial [Tanacetum coccineum]
MIHNNTSLSLLKIRNPFTTNIKISNNNLQTNTLTALHNAIMEAGGKDRPPMLAPGNYVQWESQIKRYIDTKPNLELIHYCLENPPYKYQWILNLNPDTPATLGIDGVTPIHPARVMKTYATISEEIKKKMDAEAEVVQIIRTRIDNDIYSIVDAFPISMDMWKAIGRLKQGKEIANTPLPTYDPEPEAVGDEDASLKEKEIDKLMALILISFKKIYKPTNNNLKTSSNTRNMNVDNTLKSDRRIGYDKQTRHVAKECKKAKWVRDLAYHKEKMLLYDEPEDQELEAHYMYMEKIQEVIPNAAKNSGPIFDTEPLEKLNYL